MGGHKHSVYSKDPEDQRGQMMGLRSHSKLMAKVDPRVLSFECFIIL